MGVLFAKTLRKRCHASTVFVVIVGAGVRLGWVVTLAVALVPKGMPPMAPYSIATRSAASFAASKLPQPVAIS